MCTSNHDDKLVEQTALSINKRPTCFTDKVTVLNCYMCSVLSVSSVDNYILYLWSGQSYQYSKVLVGILSITKHFLNL